MCKIIFVCTGNTCRSPMAAALTVEMFKKKGLDISVASCGVSAYGNSSASKNAIEAMKLEKIDISAHKSQLASEELLKNATLVLTMTRSHLAYVKKICPSANVFTLGEYAECNTEISDPFGGCLDEYRQCAEQISKMVHLSFEKFLRLCNPGF